jgi:hypothetical protein
MTSSLTANDFSNAFQAKVSSIIQKLRSHIDNQLSNFSLSNKPCLNEFKPTTIAEMKKVMQSISSCKVAPGDIIPISVLKQDKTFLSFICHVCNRSFSSGVFPLELKKAIITPVPKKIDGDVNDTNNYRPISNLKVFGKLIESVAATRLWDQVDASNYLHPNQSAYRRHSSTETATLKVYSDWRTALDQKKFVCVASLDVSAAFDTVNHSILLNRLIEAGVLGKAHSWLTSYLFQRTYMVKYGERFSEEYRVHDGVPQGSILGPLLFNIYMADLARCLEDLRVIHKDFNFHIYADDVLLYYSCKMQDIDRTSKSLIEIINFVDAWMTRNSLCLNVSKTELIIFQTPRNKVPFSEQDISPHVSGSQLRFRTTGTLRWLGVNFDVNLTMQDHIKKISNTCFGFLRMIKRIRNSIDTHSTCLLCSAMVLSRIDYCNALFFSSDKASILQLQKVQNFAVRLIKKAPRHCHITPLLEDVKWLTVEQRIVAKICTLIFKVLQYNHPIYLRDSLNIYSPTRDLRSSDTLSIQLVLGSANGRYGKGAWPVCAPSIWNSLPTEVRIIGKLPNFLEKLNNYLLTHVTI